jgi:hypothetical protein
VDAGLVGAALTRSPTILDAIEEGGREIIARARRVVGC